MNWFDIIIAIILVYAFFRGYRSGFIKQLASLAGIIACILLSSKVSFLILPYLREWGSIPQNLVEPAAFITSFLLIFAVFMILGHMLQTIINTIKLGLLNRLAGAALSIAKWFFIISVIINLLERIDKDRTLIPEDISEKSKTYRYIKPLAPEIATYLKFDFDEI